MPYPAKNDVIDNVVECGYSLNGGPVSHTANTILNRHIDIHPASGNAPREKGFLLCRPWSHEWANMNYRPVNSVASRHRVGPFIDDLYTCSSRDAWGMSNNAIGTFGLPAFPSSNLQNAAEVLALERLKAQEFHIGNFVAESHKTLDMVGTNVRRIAKMVQAFRSKNPKLWLQVIRTQTGSLARENWCDIPNLWLELQYGWKPLMQDVYGALNHLSSRSRFEVPFVWVKAHKFSNTQFVKRITLPNPVNGMFPNFGDYGLEGTFDDRADVWIQLVYANTNAKLAELSSLGLINPLEIVWETTKYSFVVDWFLPVGRWLSALTADTGYTFISGTKSLKAVRKFRKSNWYGTIPPAVWFDGVATNYVTYPGLGDWFGDHGNFQRTCYSSSPVPGLYVKNPLSLTHVANGLSLLVQAFR